MCWERDASSIKMSNSVCHLSAGTSSRRCHYRTGLPGGDGNARTSKTKWVIMEDSRQLLTEAKTSLNCSYWARCGNFDQSRLTKTPALDMQTSLWQMHSFPHLSQRGSKAVHIHKSVIVFSSFAVSYAPGFCWLTCPLSKRLTHLYIPQIIKLAHHLRPIMLIRADKQEGAEMLEALVKHLCSRACTWTLWFRVLPQQ